MHGLHWGIFGMCTCKSNHKTKSIPYKLYKYWWFGALFFSVALHIVGQLTAVNISCMSDGVFFFCVCSFYARFVVEFHVRAMFHCISLCRLIIHSFAINFHVIQKECMECTRLARHFFSIQNYRLLDYWAILFCHPHFSNAHYGIHSLSLLISNESF